VIGDGAGVTLFEQFKRNRDERPDAPAFLVTAGDRSVPITWRDFARDVETAAELVREFDKVRVVALLGENSYDWIVMHVACVFGGATVLPLEPTLSAAEISERLLFTGAGALLHSSLYVDKAQDAAARVPGLIVGGFGTARTFRYVAKARAQLDAGQSSVFDKPARAGSDTVSLVFTSGTTSKPRGVEVTLDGIQAFADYATAMLPMEPGDRSLMLLPLHHIYGIATTYMMLARGVALGVCPDFRRMYDAVERFRARFLFLVPALAELLAEKIERHGRSAEEALGFPVDWIVTGGAPTPECTWRHLKDLGIRNVTAYGLTETTALYSIASPDHATWGDAGKACGGMCGMETKVSSDGELMLRGPAVMKGYYKEPEITARVKDANGWFRTGDVGRIDADGYVYITGRASRTIVLSSGKKVAPEELEEKLLAVPGIREAVVSGDGEKRDLRADVFAVVSEETVRRQVDAINRDLPVHKRIGTVVVRSEPFPRTSSGKIRLAPPAPVKAGAPGTTVIVERPSRGPAMWVICCFSVMSVFVLAINLAERLVRTGALVLSEHGQRVLRRMAETGEVALGICVLAGLWLAHRHYTHRKNAK